MDRYRDLRPDVNNTFSDDGSLEERVNLKGTIPVLFKGATYNIPILIELDSYHPHTAPVVYVTPTPTMQLKPSLNVDDRGRVMIRYLLSWKWPNSNLTGLIQTLITIFGYECPVFSKVPQPGLNSCPSVTAYEAATQVQSPPPSPTMTLTGPVSRWTVDDVTAWLETLGLGQYKDRFRQNAIDGTELLDLSDADLQESLGVGPLGHRKKIMRNKEELQELQE